jgi:hypothetical protein
MSEHTPTQDKDDSRIFYNGDGVPMTLRQLVKLEPEWAASRISYYLSIHDDLVTELEFYAKQYEILTNNIATTANLVIARARGKS